MGKYDDVEETLDDAAQELVGRYKRVAVVIGVMDKNGKSFIKSKTNATVQEFTNLLNMVLDEISGETVVAAPGNTKLH